MTIHYDQPPGPLPIAPVKLIVGVFLTLIGLLLTADNLGYLDAGAYLRWWSLVLILLGALKLAQPGGRGLATLLLIAGGWILAFNLGIVSFTIFDLWPLILIGAGIAYVRKALFGARGGGGVVRIDAGAAPGEATVAVLSQRVVRPGAGYAGGRLGAFLGNCQLDLTGATLSQSPAVVETMAFMGAVEILVPDGWEVVGEVFPVMGGFDVKTGPAEEPKRQLVVRGFVIMGGVEVKTVRRSER